MAVAAAVAGVVAQDTGELARRQQAVKLGQSFERYVVCPSHMRANETVNRNVYGRLVGGFPQYRSKLQRRTNRGRTTDLPPFATGLQDFNAQEKQQT